MIEVGIGKMVKAVSLSGSVVMPSRETMKPQNSVDSWAKEHLESRTLEGLEDGINMAAMVVEGAGVDEDIVDVNHSAFVAEGSEYVHEGHEGQAGVPVRSKGRTTHSLRRKAVLWMSRSWTRTWW
ncbi:hypothetical protein Vretimale_18209 [Volvox reticuliferus]|uniref:Uncharacterized protein n=1 Tax=Volvox reticuliferus TaxID=1737510 RepID=A0A8J4D094_9CHLO|nr:hypothetical protein Vretifemale_17984 [Volvox reticuliferus]GIM15436.1 hypothetical protein Vretimale_18209 [Volvox reticuliferus]